MTRKVPIRLGDLRISEEFETSVAHRHGHVVAWGNVSPSGYWSRNGEERPRWPAVSCSVDGRECIYSPDLVVLVERERAHWRVGDTAPGRWSERLVIA